MAFAGPAHMRTLLVTLAITGLGACSQSRCPPEENGKSSCVDSTPTQHLPVVTDSFTLFVSNQSFALDPWDIMIDLDDQLAVTGDFEVGSQHTWLQFDIGLTPGTHRIRVRTADLVEVALENTFEMDDRKYGTVMFSYTPGSSSDPAARFSWSVSDE